MSNNIMKYSISDYICTITINNPPMNILTKDFRNQFVPFMEKLKGNHNVRVIIITGSGSKSFCAGADLEEEESLNQETVYQFIKEDNRNYDILNEMPQPVIAAINGYALGGGFELAIASDIRIASKNAKLGAVGVKVGLVVSPTRLVRLIGESAAKDMILTGRFVSAEEAYKKNLIYKVVPSQKLYEEALELAKVIASRAPIAVRRSKEVIQRVLDLRFNEAMDYEISNFIKCQNTYDHKHALEAFFKKEKPNFKNK